MANDLLTTIYDDADNLKQLVKQQLEKGADPSFITEYQESPLRVASNNGRFEVVKLLMSHGADESQLGWTPLNHAIVYGNQQNLEECITNEGDLEHRDFWDRTPFLLSLLTADIKKIKLLIDAGADTDAVGRCGKNALMYAIQNDDTQLLDWLLDHGFDIEHSDFYGHRALAFAAENSAIGCVKKLIDRGADVFAVDHIPQQAIELANDIDIVQLLVQAGADINKMDKEVRAHMLGYSYQETPDV